MTAADPILQAEGIGFSFRQRHSFFRHTTFRALDGVSFTIGRGQTLGVIGANGCGKSTLLKLLAGIFQPDTGTLRRNSQKVSLLSLGLAFDPELSGLSNAVISGMFLGARRSEVEARLPEIIEFCELGDFIREPIKTYSTGMRARLAFSVALTMHTDLLLVDEVLGVGDAQFREKAEAAILDRISSDQTVVLVSHSMPQVERLCDEVLWLHKGKVEVKGPPGPVLEAYERFNRTARKER